MSVRTIFVVFPLVLVLCSASPVDARVVSPSGLPPPGCWSMEDGSPARTGATATPGVRGPLEEAWAVDVPGYTIASEPRVWEDRVFVDVENQNGTHTLHVYALLDGRPAVPPVPFGESDAELELGVWERNVLVRSATGTLELLTFTGGKLKRVWSATASSAFYSPILYRDMIVALDGSDLVAWRVGSEQPLWRAEGEYRGRIAARGGYVYVVESDSEGNLSIVTVSLHAGALGRPIHVGTYTSGGVPGVGDLVEISVHDTNVFVQHQEDLRTQSRTTGWRACRLERVNGLTDRGLQRYTRLPVAAGTHWLVTEDDKETGRTLELAFNPKENPSKIRSYPLAHKKRHADFPATRVPFSVAGKMAYVGQRAFDWDTREVLWIGGDDPLYRPVPARESLLVVPSKKRMVCLREKGRAKTGPMFLGAAKGVGAEGAPAVARAEGLVLLADESWYEGPFQLASDGSKVTLFRKKGKREKREDRPIDDVTLVAGPGDELWYAPTMSVAERALAQWNFLRRANDYYKLAKAAYKSFDPDLMGELIDAAAARGVSAKKLKHPRKQHKALVSRPRKKKEKVRAKILAQRGAMTREDRARARGILESPLGDSRWPIQQIFARRLLDRDPAHEKAAALVRGRVPSYIDLPARFDALAWIDLVDELQQTRVERIAKPEGESKDLTRSQREYGSATATWRKDLVALEADELLILTPLAKPGRIAGCLGMGTLVCDALASVFSAGKSVRTDPWPLIMRLYETKKEYLDASGRDRGPGGTMEWTSGHYDPGAGISRIFLPERADAWASVMSTYAHELTHHWIAERCPLFEPRELKRLGGIAGYWIVEGMATFVEEFQWNLKARTWETNNPAADSLDVVANASPKQLLPWKSVYNMPQIVFGRLNRSKSDRKVPMRWRLGFRHLVSESGMFYAQASATCHYLYHADDASRAKLLEFVRLYYTGRIPRGQEITRHALGMGPEELGQRVIEYARAMNRKR